MTQQMATITLEHIGEDATADDLANYAAFLMKHTMAVWNLTKVQFETDYLGEGPECYLYKKWIESL